MTELEIPGCPYRSGGGDAWPRHRAKARNKTAERKRVLAAVQREIEANNAVRHCI
jgi:hypothetical protein